MWKKENVKYVSLLSTPWSCYTGFKGWMGNIYISHTFFSFYSIFVFILHMVYFVVKINVYVLRELLVS